MPKPLLATKFYIPAPRPELVPRLRLIEQLNHGLKGKLTLISAPAGFGKTTLLCECAQQCKKPTAWLSLDEGDNDPESFLSYLIAALGKTEPGIEVGLLEVLESSHTLDSVDVLTKLVNKISESIRPFVLVLDDYHVITEPDIQKMMLFVIENQPAHMHLVISSRSDPPWPLARFRVRGELSELRSQDLRFTQEEAAMFLNDMMGLALSGEDVSALESKTEGWIAGLQMAAISMRKRNDRTSFIQAFTGSHRYVIDYLMEEVLGQQTPQIQDFLLKTSILERLNSDLCDAVIGEQSPDGSEPATAKRTISIGTSQAILEAIERNNLFLIPLDDQRRWYRYHHLFGDLLKSHLQDTHANVVPDLHTKASIWYEQAGLIPDAINHALAADDIERIVHLVEGLAVYKMDAGELRAFLNWLDHLPQDAAYQYPWLMIARSWALFNSGQYEAVETTLNQVEEILSQEDVSPKLRDRIRGHIAALRSYLAEVREDVELGIQKAEDALRLLPDQDLKLRSFVAIRWANCLVGIGDFEKAIQAFQEAGNAAKLIEDGHLAITALSEMSIVQMWAGNLRQAIASIQDISNYAELLAQKDGRQSLARGILYRHLSHIKHELNELTEAEYFAEKSVKICQQWGEKEALIFGLARLAHEQFALRKFDLVDQNMSKVLELAGQLSPLTLDYFQKFRIFLQLRRGLTEDAETWATKLGLSPNNQFKYEVRFVNQIYAHLLIAKADYANALKVVNGLLEVFAEVGDKIRTIQFNVLQAIILNKIGQTNDALIAMEKALSLASAEGYVRSILDEGEAVGELLRMAITKGIEAEYASNLLSSLEGEINYVRLDRQTKVLMVESLSQRELEVLRLLVTNLTTPEIAEELCISISTARSHIKNIYGKLDAHSRHEAVTKARELGIL